MPAVSLSGGASERHGAARDYDIGGHGFYSAFRSKMYCTLLVSMFSLHHWKALHCSKYMVGLLYCRGSASASCKTCSNESSLIVFNCVEKLVREEIGNLRVSPGKFEGIFSSQLTSYAMGEVLQLKYWKGFD